MCLYFSNSSAVIFGQTQFLQWLLQRFITRKIMENSDFWIPSINEMSTFPSYRFRDYWRRRTNVQDIERCRGNMECWLHGHSITVPVLNSWQLQLLVLDPHKIEPDHILLWKRLSVMKHHPSENSYAING